MPNRTADSDQRIVQDWLGDGYKAIFRRRLLRWYRSNRRDLPWRTTPDPYRVWISEIMLQQTQVTTVIDYFHRFMSRFPNVRTLANADLDDVLRLWEGLGYYRRARQLHAAAKVIVNEFGGAFPQEVSGWQNLPGVGRYTAGAITSIALNRPAPILEGNTIRLFARLLGLEADVRSTRGQRILWSFSEELVDGPEPSKFNQAVMELGSLVCRDRQPQCTACPAWPACRAFSSGNQTRIPVSSYKVVYEKVCEAAIIATRGGKVLMRQCQPGERWTGLWDFPRFPWLDHEPERQLASSLEQLSGLRVALTPDSFSLRHAVTRFRIELRCFRGEVVGGRLATRTAFRWVSLAELPKLPLSATGRRIANHFLRAHGLEFD